MPKSCTPAKRCISEFEEFDLMISILLNLTGKIALLMLLGYFLRKYNIITEQFQKDITSFMLKVALPANVLTTANNPFSRELSTNLLLTAVIAVVYYSISLLLTHAISRFLPLSQGGKVVFMTSCVFANTAFIGFPLATELLGSEGLLYAVIFNLVWIVFFYTIGISLLSGQKTIRLKTLFTMPVSVASFCAVLIYLSPFRFPGFIQDTLSTLGAMVAPISMIVVGCSLVHIRPIDILKDGYSYFVSVMRMAVFPAAVLLVLKLIPGIPNIVSTVCCLACCLPGASMNVVFAQEYNCDPQYASRAVVQGTLLMVVTVPLFMSIAMAAFPL